MFGNVSRRLIGRQAVAAIAAAFIALPAVASDVQFPVGSSVGLVPPAGLRLDPANPAFYDPDHQVSIVLLELPRAAYPRVEASMTTAAAKELGVILDLREVAFTAAGTAVLSAGEDTRANARKWMMVALTSRATVLVSVEIPHAARERYPDALIRAALATLTERDAPINELLGLLPYRLDELAGFRVVTVLNRSTVVLTKGPRDDMHAVEQPHLVIGIAPSIAGQASDRARLAELAFSSLPGLAERRVTTAEMLRVTGQPVHEIRAEARDVATGTPVSVVQWIRFGPNAYLHIIGVTMRDNWSRDFPTFRAVRDGVQPKR
jgi:hypothetical protein